MLLYFLPLDRKIILLLDYFFAFIVVVIFEILQINDPEVFFNKRVKKILLCYKIHNINIFRSTLIPDHKLSNRHFVCIFLLTNNESKTAGKSYFWFLLPVYRVQRTVIGITVTVTSVQLF